MKFDTNSYFYFIQSLIVASQKVWVEIVNFNIPQPEKMSNPMSQDVELYLANLPPNIIKVCTGHTNSMYRSYK